LEVNGASYYITVGNNSLFIQPYFRFIQTGGASLIGPGIDMHITNSRFLSAPETSDYGFHFDTFDSLVMDGVIVSTSNFTAGVLYFDRPTNKQGGVTIANSVFEAGNNGATSWIVGAPGANPWHIHADNNLITGGTAAALQCKNSNRLRITGGGLGTSATTGSIVSFPPGSTCTEFLFNGTTFDANSAIDAFSTTASNVTLSGSIFAPSWLQTTPLVDFTSLAAGNIDYLDVIGGSVGSNVSPVQLPVGVKGVRCYQSVSCGGSATALANPTASVGLSAVNGAAATAMRSDAAPPLDQSISPNMKGNWTFTQAITSTKATGAPPFTVASTSKVVNLYADRAALADTVTTNANLTGDVASVGNATTYNNIVSGAKGGSGVANTGKTITIGASLTTTGAGAPTLAFPGSPATYTFPGASQTLASLAGIEALTNKDLTGAGNTFPTFNQNTTGSAAKWTTARTLAGNSVDGSANVPFPNKFIVQGTTDAGLSGAQFMGALGTGLVKNTTTTGVQSVVAEGTGVEAALGVNVGTAGAFVVNGGAGGTPSSINLSNATALPPSALGGLSKITASLGADIALGVANTYFDGPSIAQGSTGTWWASGGVTLLDISNAESYRCKLWDGTTLIDSRTVSQSANNTAAISLSGPIVTPVGNIKITCKASSATSVMTFNTSAESHDSTVSAFRIN
jgi:hypothetical protein